MHDCTFAKEAFVVICIEVIMALSSSMNMMVFPCLLVAAFMQAPALFAQDFDPVFVDFITRATKAMDAGHYEESRQLLHKADSVTPNTAIVSYEFGYSFMLQGKPDSALPYYATAYRHAQATDQFYSAYASALDDRGRSDEAKTIYDEGIGRFPASFILRHERGVWHARRQEHHKAVDDFQAALERKPDFAPSFLRCAQSQFAIGSNTFWGLIEAEIFMNLEPHSERSKNLASEMVDVYKKNIVFSDKGVFVTFSADAALDADGTTRIHKKSRHAQPYGLGGFEVPMMYSANRFKELNAKTLLMTRIGFHILYERLKVDSTYGQNPLFDYWARVKEAGFEVPYHLWVFRGVYPELILEFALNNPGRLAAFEEWQKQNPIVITKDRPFLRNRYD